jgi:divalent metal cation (Fe/Co/Zn/Cd) transporter
VSDPSQRQQTKWVFFGVVTALGGACGLLVLSMVVPRSVLASLVGTTVLYLLVLLIPVSIAIAVLRYHLYNIDVLINRTLVYASLSVLLALIYFGGVTATEAIFRSLTGQEKQPQLAVVVSTLVIAALFNPLRRSIQGFIDRRFYRRKYDARKTLETFSSKLRDETDLDALSEDLVGVVRETMQPAHVSLWLRPDTTSKGRQVD